MEEWNTLETLLVFSNATWAGGLVTWLLYRWQRRAVAGAREYIGCLIAPVWGITFLLGFLSIVALADYSTIAFTYLCYAAVAGGVVFALVRAFLKDWPRIKRERAEREGAEQEREKD